MFDPRDGSRAVGNNRSGVGQWNGSAKEGACGVPWRPVFNPSGPVKRWTERPDSTQLPSALQMCAVACMPRHTHIETLRYAH